jgi:DNA-binding MarR family transcriptional regulator
MAAENEPEISKADYEALHAFRHALRRFMHFSEEGARAAGLTAQQHQLLLAVKGQPGRDWATITDLAESLQIRHHAAVGLVDRCARAGLVVRTQSPNDRRQVHVTLTNKGEEVLAGLSTRNRRELQTLRHALGPVGLKEVARDD